MKLGYVTGGFAKWSFREKVEFAQKLGLQSLNMDYNEALGHKAKENPDFPGILSDHDVGVGTLNTPVQLVQPELRQQTMENCRHACEVAHILGCRMLQTMAIFPKGIEIPERDLWKQMGALTREACEICAGEDVALAVEADPPAIVQNLERMERLLNTVNHKNLFINFDPTNYYMSGSDPLLVIERLGHKIIAGHIKDGIYKPDSHFAKGVFTSPDIQVEHGFYSTKHEVPIGTGEVDYPVIFKAMKRKGIDVPMHIEHVGFPEQVINAVNYIRGVLERSAI